MMEGSRNDTLGEQSRPPHNCHLITTMKSNIHLQNLVHELKKHSNVEQVGVWKRVALDLEKPTRCQRIVNLSRINTNTKNNETIVVPGKVLGGGELDHTVHVAAYAFSVQAKDKIQKAKGSVYSLLDLVKQNPKGKDVRIIG